MVEINKFSFRYEKAEGFAVKDITLSIQQGEFVGIIGASGAGKSTLLMALNGIVPHFYHGDFYGSVKVCSLDTVENKPAAISNVAGSVLQDPDAQIITETVEEEIAFSLENKGMEPSKILERIDEALEMTGIGDLRNRYTNDLSGGQKQRVCVAAAIAQRPQVLILDEPTSALDPLGSDTVFATLKKLNEQYNITVIVVEQKVAALCEYCKRMFVMDKGEIVLDGKTEDVLRNSDKLVKLGINCPRIVSLAGELKNRGLYSGAFPKNIIEAENMVRAVIEK